MTKTKRPKTATRTRTTWNRKQVQAKYAQQYPALEAARKHQEPEKPAKNPVGSLLVAKADLCVAVARLMIPKAPEDKVEECAVALMYMSSSKLIETYDWLVKS